jgi:signal transduction histidine kinase
VFGGDGRLKLSNPAYARIWNLRSDDLMGEPHVVELIEKMKSFFDYGDDWQGFKEDTIGNTLDRTPRSGRIERSDGSVIEFANVPLPDGAVLNSFLDVTDSVRVEQALRERNAALETADRLKAEFIANVSYQLRTPLNAIMGFAEILVNRYFGELNERQLDYCRAILESGQRLLLLINDILDLATVEAGFMVLERSAVDIRALLDSVVDLTREWARKQQLELEISCPADIGTVEADEKRLKQALFNLISNAIKFTPPGGRIVLSAQRTDDAVALCVSDTGIGIPPADQERVFGRFERTNPQARQAGAGLGLSLVKSFVELHGGHVDIESRVNKGTRIRCTLSGKPQGKPALIGNARTNPVN